MLTPGAEKAWKRILFQGATVPFKTGDYKVPSAMAGALNTISSGQEMGYNVSVVVPAKFVDVYWDGLIDVVNSKSTSKEWVGKLQQQWDIAKTEGRIAKA